MTKRWKTVTVGGTTYEVRDIDLDKEEVYLKDGTRLTEAKAAELGDEIARKGREIRAAQIGRPSLSSPGGTSPQITVRLSPEFMREVDEIASRQGKTRSQLSREALEKLVKSERRRAHAR